MRNGTRNEAKNNLDVVFLYYRGCGYESDFFFMAIKALKPVMKVPRPAKKAPKAVIMAGSFIHCLSGFEKIDIFNQLNISFPEKQLFFQLHVSKLLIRSLSAFA